MKCKLIKQLMFFYNMSVKKICGLFRFKTVVKSQLGISLVGTLISLPIIGLVIIVTLSVVSFYNKESKYIKQQMTGMSVNYLILQTFAKSDNCTCQFNSHRMQCNGEGNNMICTDISQIREIKTGCNASADTIVKENTELYGDLGIWVEDIKVSGIKKASERPGTDPEYKGNLSVRFKSPADSGLVRNLPDLLIPLTFQVNPDDDNKITSCLKEEKYSCYDITMGGDETNIGCKKYAADETPPTVGTGTTFFGFNAGKRATGSKGVFLGYKAGEEVTTGDNKVFIGPEIDEFTGTDGQNFIGHVFIGRIDEPSNLQIHNKPWLIGEVAGSNTDDNRLYVRGKPVAMQDRFDDLNEEFLALQADMQAHKSLRYTNDPNNDPHGGHHHGTPGSNRYNVTSSLNGNGYANPSPCNLPTWSPLAEIYPDGTATPANRSAVGNGSTVCLGP